MSRVGARLSATPRSSRTSTAQRRPGDRPQHQHHPAPHRRLEALRDHLGVDRRLVWGASWGAALALAYAEAHPDRVTERSWVYPGVGRFFPESWDTFRLGLPEPDRRGNLVTGYRRLLESSEPPVRERAAFDWCVWEDSPGMYEDGWAAATDRFRPPLR